MKAKKLLTNRERDKAMITLLLKGENIVFAFPPSDEKIIEMCAKHKIVINRK